MSEDGICGTCKRPGLGKGYRICAYCNSTELKNRLSVTRDFIADDSYAIQFQTIGQYRTALLKGFDGLLGGYLHDV